jgi:molybdopterin converting factor small subunit
VAEPIVVELTYEMSKELGTRRFQLEAADTVADVVRAARDRFGERAAAFEQLGRVAAVAVNGVLISHRKGMKTKLSPGDTVTFVKAAAGG